MKKIDVEKIYIPDLIDDIKTMIYPNGHGQHELDEQECSEFLEKYFSNLASEQEKCEECGGIGYIQDYVPWTFIGDKETCEICHGTGNKPDPVLSLIETLKNCFSEAEMHRNCNSDYLDGYEDAKKFMIEVLFHFEQQRKKELGK